MADGTGATRFLEWDGCHNTRDLHLPGGPAPAVLVRSDRVTALTAVGWEALLDHGVRTVIDLRNPDETAADTHTAPRPPAVTTLHVPLDGIEHRDFWDVWWGTPGFGSPEYYVPFLRRFPERIADVARAVAHAGPGGVLFHCALGRDRTGLIALVLLRLAGAEPDRIAADHALSDSRMPAWHAAHGRAYDPGPVEARMAELGTTGRELARRAAEWLDAPGYLRYGGLDADELRALRGRLEGDA
ncbi:tyrosine-protein phosphatase [Streptomyces sp. NPDC089799]|uniref:tyrosine-protein phosphatase n=1 Tax=Streptomyces sp. NPDC089799 TaxID=3155066 RepID=UPI0034125B35